MKAEEACLSCLRRRNEERMKSFSDEKRKLEYRRETEKIIEQYRLIEPAPGISERVDKLFFDFWGEKEDFSALKSKYNLLLLKKEKDLRNRMENSEDPILSGIKYVAAANYIDFMAVENVNEDMLETLLKKAETVEIDNAEYAEFLRELENSEKLTYLTDNCGEIVLDKIFMMILKNRFPKLEITAVVRGGNVVNDASMDDAEEVGLTSVVRCIGNGTKAAGTVVNRLSKEAKTAIFGADIVLSKGQGNFESLYGEGSNPYYLFLCKCELFTERFGVKRFETVFCKEERIKRFCEDI